MEAKAMTRIHEILKGLKQSPKVNVFSNGVAGGKENPRDVVVVGYARTPLGGLQGKLSAFTAPELGAFAIKGALEKAHVKPEQVQEVFMGNVLSAGMGQAPARQAALKAGIPQSVDCTTINKVCASGTKAIILGSQAISLGYRDIVVVGGMESMSQVPYYLPKVRTGYRMGHQQVVDGVIHDGLWDAYHNCHMGAAGERCSKTYSITREQQDDYAIESYKRAQNSFAKGYFKDEIVPITVVGKNGKKELITEDEEPSRVKFDAVRGLKATFEKNGTITAANASVISDGAAALVLMSRQKAAELKLTPLATIRGYSDAAVAPLDFPIAPAVSVPLALKNAGLKQEDIDLYEINEAFSVVVLANMKLLNVPADKMNIWGGAVALGHPIGCSGARIVCTLISALRHNNKKTGLASICNGGGGASAVIVSV